MMVTRPALFPLAWCELEGSVRLDLPVAFGLQFGKILPVEKNLEAGRVGGGMLAKFLGGEARGEEQSKETKVAAGRSHGGFRDWIGWVGQIEKRMRWCGP